MFRSLFGRGEYYYGTLAGVY